MKNKATLFILAIAICFGFLQCSKKMDVEKEMNFIQENISFSTAQTRQMLEVAGEPTGKNIPGTMRAKDGELARTSIWGWTSGFFPGSLWYLYELTGDDSWKTNAEQWTWAMEPVKTFTDNHDIGFMMYCSYGNAERLASKPEYKDILIESANSLCTRYNDTTKTIKSWNYRKAWNGTEWFFPVIIDNMMNLELLFHATKVTGDRKYYDIAVTHANTTLENHFRDDHSSYHVVDYDTISGKVLHQQTCQGLSDNSTWSRGQAWAVYGYTMMYRETKDKVYLDAAKNMADYFINNLPEDLVPYWDFNLGQEGFAAEGKSYAVEDHRHTRDASAASIVCSALFELGELANDARYTDQAIAMLKSLASPVYRAVLGENVNFILMHSTGSFPHKSEIDVPLNYADYYFLEALVRYKKLVEKA